MPEVTFAQQCLFLNNFINMNIIIEKNYDITFYKKPMKMFKIKES